MRRPFGFIFALFAVWLQVLAPAVAARAAIGPALDPASVICDHLGQANGPGQPQPAQDDHHAACCLAHHHIGADLLAPDGEIVLAARIGLTIARVAVDDPAATSLRLAAPHARGPPRLI